MEQINAKKAGSAAGEDQIIGSEQAEEFLSEFVVDHIDKLLKEDAQPVPATLKDLTSPQDKHTSFRQALRELLADPNIRMVLELHFGTWLKDDPVKRWLWECSQAMEHPEMLEDTSYLDELEALLAQVTTMAGEARENPELMRLLLQRLLTSPWQFMAPAG